MNRKEGAHVIAADAYDPERVAIVGLGKIGLGLACYYAIKGRPVIGCDVNLETVSRVNSGRCLQYEVGLTTSLAELVDRGRLVAVTDTAAAVRICGTIIVTVPVSLYDDHRPDYRQLDSATDAIGSGLRLGSLVLYASTMPVGTTRGRCLVMLEDRAGLRSSSGEFHLGYSPERVRVGRMLADLQSYPRVVGAVNEESLTAATRFYGRCMVSGVIGMPSTDAAEFVKLMENTYRDVNIALANELARFADLHGLDVTRAIAAANSQPTSHIHSPGVGVGGHCIPVDPYLLASSIEKDDVSSSGIEDHLRLPRVAREVNDGMPDYAVSRLESVMGPLSGRAVLILGVAYRGDVRETAFSAAARIHAALLARGAVVYASDPLFTEEELTAQGYSVLPAGTDHAISAVVLHADHAAYRSVDLRRFRNCRVVLDGRSALAEAGVVGLGMSYIAIGRGAAGA